MFKIKVLINQFILFSEPKACKSDCTTSTYAPPANSKRQYIHLLRLNVLLPPSPTNSDHLTLDIANKIFQLAQAARDVRVQAIRSGKGLERESYVKDIIIEVLSKFKLCPTPPILDTLLNTLENPLEPYPQQVEKAFLLAIRILYRSIDAGRAIARPLTQHPKKESPAFSKLIW